MKIDSMTLGALATNTYIVSNEHRQCAIIDPAAQAKQIIQFIDKHEYIPQWILITHPHFDHIGAVGALQARYGAKAVVSRIDYEGLVTGPNPLYGAGGLWSSLCELFEADRTVEDGDAIVMQEITFRVLLTPGHSAGGVCYLCGRELFTGDTLFAGGVGRCDLYSGDFNAILRSVDRLAALPGDYRVYPGHGPCTTLGQERAHNDYIGMLQNEDLY